MNFILKRDTYTRDGIFGHLLFEGTEEVYAAILEHPYLQPDGSYLPKVTAGTYTCLKGDHKLEGMDHTFIAFELQNVPPFQGNNVSGILIHVGNTERDSSGCLLIGQDPPVYQRGKFIVNSRDKFNNFMKMQQVVEEFTLTIIDAKK